MKPKSDYAIVISCNPGYGFGLISSMNAQDLFKTNADWEIAYEDYTEEQRNKISQAFNFNVNWTPISDLMTEVVDKRTDQSCPLNRFWLAYWLLAHRLLREKKYKAVCVIQADQFVGINLDVYFKIAEAGILVSTEYDFSYINAEDLPFGNDKAIWNRFQCGIFDGVNFLGQEHTVIPRQIVEFQCEDAFRDESNHSVIALNRAVCKYGSKDRILRLERHLWMCDSKWHTFKFIQHGNRVYNDRMCQINGWHCRWWQIGRVAGEWLNHKTAILNNKNNSSYLSMYEIMEHNFNFLKSYMERFNSMKPEISSDCYTKGYMRRPRFELGEV